MQNGTATLKDSLAVSYKTKHPLTIWFSSCTLWYLPRGVENLSLHKHYTWILYFIALLSIAKTWKQPRCTSIGKWINKLWYIQETEYYSALKRNEQSSCEKPCRETNCILLSERSQYEKPYMIPTTWYSKKVKTMEMVKRSMVARALGAEHRGFGGSKTILVDTIIVYTCHCTFAKTHRIYNTKCKP